MESQVREVSPMGQLSGMLADNCGVDSSCSRTAAFLKRNSRFSRRRSTAPIRVLIVDGEIERCAGLAVQIQQLGLFQTRMTCSTASMLDIASDFLPGVVMISVDLPDLGGYRLAAALERNSRLATARRIALTTSLAAADRCCPLAMGFEDCLHLPVQTLALQRALLSGLYTRTRSPLGRQRGPTRH